jgi:hypothetical protein
LNSVQVPAKAASGLSSLSANHTRSFFLVSGFGSGAYSAKLLNGTKQRLSGLSQPRQCGDELLRILFGLTLGVEHQHVPGAIRATSAT